MEEATGYHRRRFLQTAAGAAMSPALQVPLFETLISAGQRRARFAYVGAENAIWVYSIVTDQSLIKQQMVASLHPVAMAIRNWNLYVVNSVSEFAGLPCGTVESYGIDASTGTLKFRNRVPLSLSAVRPRSLALSPDGRAVVVAVHGGGAYNVLPIQEDGSLGRVVGILKETGAGPHSLQRSAHPAAVLFDSAGRVLSVDLGSDSLNVFALLNYDMETVCRRKVISGSGPTSIVLHPKEDRFYVAQSFSPSVSSFKYDARNGNILEQETVRTSFGDGLALLAIHPSGEALYSSHGRGIQGWKIAGKALMRSSSEIEDLRPTGLYVTQDGKNLFALTSDAVLRSTIDTSTKMFTAMSKVASIGGPLSIALV